MYFPFCLPLTPRSRNIFSLNAMGHPHSVDNVCMEGQILRADGRQSSISPRCLAGCTLTLVLYFIYYKNRNCICNMFRLCKCQYHTVHQWDGYSVNVFCNSTLTPLRLEQRFYSQMNCASLGLESSTFAMNMCGWMKILIRLNLIISNNSFP